MADFPIIFFSIAAYLFGSLSSAILVCKAMGLPDPRTVGSKNPGTTNVLRIGGKKAAFITLLGDLLKGFIPVLLARWYNLSDFGVAAVAFAAFIGHLYPIYFSFKGGKGVATALGCLLAISPAAGLCCVVTWVLIAVVTRYSSLAALITSILAPVYIWFFTEDKNYIMVAALMTAFLIYRHRANIAHLLAGTEHKIGKIKVTI